MYQPLFYNFLLESILQKFLMNIFKILFIKRIRIIFVSLIEQHFLESARLNLHNKKNKRSGEV